MSTMWQTGESYTCNRFAKSYRNIVPAGNLNFQNGRLFENELVLDEIKFIRKIYKNSNKIPLFVNCLVEFGCECLLPHFILDHVKKTNSKYKFVVLGWKGREWLYRHIADEFWEIDEKCMFLREYVRAFINVSKNINNIEKSLTGYGLVFSSKFLGNYFLESVCETCKFKVGTVKKFDRCPKCGSHRFKNSILADTKKYKTLYKKIDSPYKDYSDWAEKIIGDKKTIGIFARNRKTYGRNLQISFYENLINRIRAKGYRVIWLGESVSTLNCPDNNVYDFTKSCYVDNIEACAALVAKCCATFQCWTASTRISQMVNTPFFLVESPDQIYGNGQEGKRIYLLTQNFDNKKVYLANFHKVCQNLDFFTGDCIHHLFDFIENKNSNDIVGLVDNTDFVEHLMKENKLW